MFVHSVIFVLFLTLIDIDNVDNNYNDNGLYNFNKNSNVVKIQISTTINTPNFMILFDQLAG